MKLLSAHGPLYLGVSYYTAPLYGVGDYASSINIGAQPSSIFGVEGTDIQLDGKTIDLGTPSLTVNNKPMFLRKTVSVSASTSSTVTVVSHGINLSDYEVAVVGWGYSGTSPYIRSVYQNPTYSYATVSFTSTPSSGTITLYFLGIRKGLSDLQ